MYESQPNVRRTPVVYLNMRDPYLLKYYYRFKTIELMDREDIHGSSPPDIFVGRMGYPNVYIGPLVPPVSGDTSIMASPENWVGKTIPEIVEYRSMLVRGMHRENVRNAENSRIGDMLQELAIAEKYTSVDMELTRKPSLIMKFDENSQPFGPSAPLKNVFVGNTKANKDVEKAYSDTDMSAGDAITELYNKGIAVSQVQKALSAGALGRQKNRRFVPTRWSITAVDDTLSKRKLSDVKEYESIDSIIAFENIALDNRWIVLLFPGSWSYELIEAWYPDTAWNPTKEIAIFSSSEFFEGRKTYAEIGGCYYAARLAVSEFLDKVQAQARVVILRETHSGYIMPVGVWNVREHVREALKKKPVLFDSVSRAFEYVSNRMSIPLGSWINNSALLKNILHQRVLAVQ